MIRKVNGRGGIVAYLNTTNALEIDDRIKNGDEYGLKIIKALAYQVAKEIGVDEEGFIAAAKKTQIVPKAAI